MLETQLAEQLDPAFEAALMERIRTIPCYSGFGMEILSFAPGECQARVPRNEAMDGIYECFHGGLLMAVADTVACFAMMTLTGPETQTATTDMNIRFLAPCHSAVTAVAKVIKLGKTMCPLNIDLYDDANRLVAVAQANYMRLERASRPAL